MNGPNRNAPYTRPDEMIRERNLAASLERLSVGRRQRGISTTLQEFLVKHSAGTRRLDLGCGMGEILEALGPEAIGIDFLAENCQHCHSEGLTVVRADANIALPVRSEAFDIVLCSHVLEHLKCPLDAVEEIRRVLAGRGLVVLCLPTPRGVVRDLVDGYFSDHPSHLFAFDIASIERLLEIAGFRIVDVLLSIPGSDTCRVIRIIQDFMNLNPALFLWLSSSFWVVASKE